MDYKISFSEYSTFLQCQHKWYLSYCLKLPGDLNTELIFGQIVHKSIEDILKKKNLRKPMFYEGIVKFHLKEELSKITDINFLTNFDKAGLTWLFIKQTIEILITLNFFVRFKEYEIVNIEYQLDDLVITEQEETKFIFNGFIDLVLKNINTGRYLLLDWKTSKKPWDIKQKLKDNEDLFTQLGLYKYFFSIKTGVPMKMIDVKFFNLPRENSKEMVEHAGILNDSYIEYLVDKFKTTCKEIYNHDLFQLNKSKFLTKKNYCHRCHFNKEELCNNLEQFQIVNA